MIEEITITKRCIWCGEDVTNDWDSHPFLCNYFRHILDAHRQNKFQFDKDGNLKVVVVNERKP